MNVDRVQNVIRRKAEAGRAQPQAAPMSVPRGVSLALAKAAQDGMELPLRVLRLDERRLSLAELPETLEERSLLAVLEGPGEGLGLAAIAPSLLAALIEVQTTGKLAATAPPPRRPTRTDAAMVAGFIDKVLAGFEETIAELPEVVWAGGFRYASYLDDPRPLGLLLEDAGFRVMQIELALGAAGARKGRLVLALPAIGRGSPPRHAEGADDHEGMPQGGAQADAARWKEGMERVVLQSSTTLEAVLHRVTLPLSAVLAFVPGTELPVPLAALEQVRLEGLGGRLLAQGRLGQHRGFRAARLGAAADEAEAPRPAPQPEVAAPPPPTRPTPRLRPAAPASDGPTPEPAPRTVPMSGFAAEPRPLPARQTAGPGTEPTAMVPLKIGSVF